MKIEDVMELIRVQLGVGLVRPNHDFQKDLGAESADVLNIVAAVEDRWNILISEEELAGIRTVTDLISIVEADLNTEH